MSDQTEIDYDLYGGVPPHVSGSDTSQDSAKRIKEHVGPIALKLYRLIHEAGAKGYTVDELEFVTSGKHQTVGPRIREMVLQGILRATENRRLTRSKRYGVVYVTTGEDPRPSVKTRTDWKKIAVSLFNLVGSVDRVVLNRGLSSDNLCDGVGELCRMRFNYMTVGDNGEPQPRRSP